MISVVAIQGGRPRSVHSLWDAIRFELALTILSVR